MTPVTARPLLLSDELSRTGTSDRVLQRSLARGEVVRIRRGAYCETAHWAGLDSRGRHLLRMHAVAAASSKTTIFCGQSAAAAWSLPRQGAWEDRVCVAVPAASGGRSSGDIRRRVMPLAGARINEIDGLLVTGLASTAVQEALDLDFATAVGVLDSAVFERNPHGVTKDELLAELARLAPRRHAGRALAAIGFAVPVSESFGESVTRARLHELGFPPPVLQSPIFDERGLIGRVDFHWREQGIVGEFDGAVKYQRAEYLSGRTPEQAVWLEKQREDRLRRKVAGLFRVVWAEAMDPARLDRVARASGLQPSAR